MYALLDWRRALESSKAKICRVDRVLCGILLSLRVEPAPGLGSLGVNEAGVLLVDPRVVEEMVREGRGPELTRTLIHEALHILFLHPQRCRKLGDQALCNLAADAIVEATIDESVLGDPSLAQALGLAARGVVYAPRYGSRYHQGLEALREILGECGVEWSEVPSKTLEELYRRLLECLPRRPARATVIDAHPWGGAAAPTASRGGGISGDRLERAARIAVKMVREAGGGAVGITSKLPGVAPGEIERVLEELGVVVRLDWRQALHRLLERLVPSDYTWRRPSRRSQAVGATLPGVLKRAWKIAVVLDTSGSIDEEEYAEFIRALYQLLITRPVASIVVAEADVKIQRMEVFTDPPPPLVERWLRHRRGYGGTNFAVPIRQLLEKHPDTSLIIYFTDGYGVYPKRPPRIPIVWVISRKGVKPGNPYWPPHGYIITMSDGRLYAR